MMYIIYLCSNNTQGVFWGLWYWLLWKDSRLDTCGDLNWVCRPCVTVEMWFCLASLHPCHCIKMNGYYLILLRAKLFCRWSSSTSPERARGWYRQWCRGLRFLSMEAVRPWQTPKSTPLECPLASPLSSGRERTFLGSLSSPNSILPFIAPSHWEQTG